MQWRSIHYLRGVAALMVVVYHLHTTQPFLGYVPDRHGWLVGGVDIFFLISGFVMVEATRHKALAPGAFLAARLRRIVPTYWLFSALMLGSLDGQTLYKIASFLFIPMPRADGLFHPLLSPGWTLNYEIFFYGLFALSLYIAPRWRFAALVGTLLLLGASDYFAPLPGLLRYYSSAFLWEFVIGMAVARFRPRGHGLMIPAGFLLMMVSYPLLDDPFARLAPGATLVLIGALALERRLPDWRPLRLLGDASYMLYLCHMFVFTALGEWGVPHAIFAVVAMVVTPLIAVLLHRLVEQPIQSRLQAKGVTSSAAIATRTATG